MCFRNSWFDERQTLMSDEAVQMVSDALESDAVEGVFLGGMGEPLMHQSIFDLIKTAHTHNKSTELITNATLLSEATCDELLEAGLDTLWVSMDGFTRESYESVRRGSLYQNIVQNLTYFNSRRTKTKLGITFVMMKENLGELSAINGFADKYRVDVINLSHVVPCNPLKSEDSVYDLPYRIGKMHRFDPNEEFFKRENLCPFVDEDVCFIRSDGEVCPCMQLLHNSYTYLYEEKRKVHAHSFGNICNTPLAEILSSFEYADFRNRVSNFEFPCCTICMGCEDRKENKTDCMYNIAPTCGACLWSQGYIRCP